MDCAKLNTVTMGSEVVRIGMHAFLNCESLDGSPHSLYCPSADALPQGLKKGDIVSVLFDVTYYKGNERLVVRKVEKVDNV